jgi:hypothetical protein
MSRVLLFAWKLLCFWSVMAAAVFVGSVCIEHRTLYIGAPIMVGCAGAMVLLMERFRS